MIAPNVLDVAPESCRASVASALVRSALSEIKNIQHLDELLGESALGQQFNRSTAEALRALYEDWCRQVEALERRIGILEKSNVKEAMDLAHAYGRTRAMLSISLDDLEEAMKDIAEGRTIPAEEVRRELRDRVHQTSQSPTGVTGDMAARGNLG